MKKLLLITLIIPFISLAQELEIEKLGLLVYFEPSLNIATISTIVTPYESNSTLKEGDEVKGFVIEGKRYNIDSFESLLKFQSFSLNLKPDTKIAFIGKRNRSKFFIAMRLL